jgi:hypothetical protein
LVSVVAVSQTSQGSSHTLQIFLAVVLLITDCEEDCVEASVILELSDQKARGFFVSISLKRLFPEYAN